MNDCDRLERRLIFYAELSDIQTKMLRAMRNNRNRVRFNLSYSVDAPMRRAIELYFASFGFPFQKELYEIFEYDVYIGDV